MDQQTTQPRGDFVAFINRDKQPGDKRPAFEGRVSKPGSYDKYPLTLWAHEYTDPKTGEVKVMFSGTIEAVATTAPAAAQISAFVAGADKAKDATLGNLTIAPRQVVLFPNGFKADAPDKGLRCQARLTTPQRGAAPSIAFRRIAIQRSGPTPIGADRFHVGNQSPCVWTSLLPSASGPCSLK